MHISMTTDVIPVTREHVKRLVDRNREHGDQTRQAVMNVIRQIGEPISPHKIKGILYSGVHSELSRKYEEGKIDRHEFDKKIKEQTIDIRTIHRKLSALVREGVLKKEHGTYELTIKAMSDVRYFAREFGKDTLNVLMKHYLPAENSVKENVNFMVRLFGTYILFCFMETARPVSHMGKQSRMYGPMNHEVVSSCLQNIIRVENMFSYFLAVLDYLLSDDKTKSDKYNIEKIYAELPSLRNERPKGRPLDAVEIAYLRNIDMSEKAKPVKHVLERNLKEMDKKFKEGTLTYAEMITNYLPPEDPNQGEISQHELEVFAKAFSKADPEIYEKLVTMVSTFKENPKKKIMDLRNTWKQLY